MPTYVYKCPVCGRVKEVTQKHDDPPPECDVEWSHIKTMVRVPQTFGINWKEGKPT